MVVSRWTLAWPLRRWRDPEYVEQVADGVDSPLSAASRWICDLRRYGRVKGGVNQGKESSKVNWDCTICPSLPVSRL